MHFFFNFDFITAAVWQLIFAQMTFAIDRPRSTVGLNAKKPAKNLNSKFFEIELCITLLPQFDKFQG